MKASISFLKSNEVSLEEKTLPIVKLTRSKNGLTGTASFIFIKPNIFNSDLEILSNISGMYLYWGIKTIKTNDIKIIFKEGQPFLIKSLFIFRNSQEWFSFLDFMTCYSQETGLLFSEKKPLS